jgi:cystathionine gamma-synthase
MTTKDRETRGSATRAVRAGIATDGEWGAVVPPIHPSSTFTYDGLDGKRRYDYTRSGNPTRDLLGDAIAGLEGGAGSVITSSGMSAVALVLHLLEPGQLLIAPHDCYGGTIRLMKALSERGHFDLLFVDQTDEVALAAAFARRPRICWVETPSGSVSHASRRMRCSSRTTPFSHPRSRNRSGSVPTSLCTRPRNT